MHQSLCRHAQFLSAVLCGCAYELMVLSHEEYSGGRTACSNSSSVAVQSLETKCTSYACLKVNPWAAHQSAVKLHSVEDVITSNLWCVSTCQGSNHLEVIPWKISAHLLDLWQVTISALLWNKPCCFLCTFCKWVLRERTFPCRSVCFLFECLVGCLCLQASLLVNQNKHIPAIILCIR